MAILITGAGLIGTEAALQLAARGEQVCLLDFKPDTAAVTAMAGPGRVDLVRADVEDLAAIERVLREHRIDRVLHTAAFLTAGMSQDLLRGIRTNVIGTATVLEAARRNGVRRVVLAASSTAYYGLFNEPAAEPYPEDFTMRVVSQRPQSLYSATKLAGEHLGLIYQHTYGVDVVIVRFAAVLGLSAYSTGGIGGRLLRTLLEPAICGKPAVIDDPLIVWRGGDEFVDYRDAASGAIAALFAEQPNNRVYSIGPGILSSFDDFVQAVRQVAPDFRAELLVEPTGGFAGYRYLRPQPADNRAARRELGWAAQYDLAATMSACSAYLAGKCEGEAQ